MISELPAITKIYGPEHCDLRLKTLMEGKTIKQVLFVEEYLDEKGKRVIVEGGTTFIFTDGSFVIMGYTELGEWVELSGGGISINTEKPNLLGVRKP